MSARRVSDPLTMLPLRLVKTEESFLALAPYWDALLERSRVRTPFMTWDWVSLRWEQQRDHCKLCVAVIDDPATGEPLAIAPLVVGREPAGPRKALRTFTFIGCLGEAPSQGMDFIVPAGRESEFTPRLCEVFSKTSLPWDVIDLPTIHGESANLPLIRQALSKFADAGERQPEQTCYYMTLPDSWDAQMAAWKSKERCIFRSKWKKMMDEHAGRTLQGGRDVPAAEAFAHLWRLHGLRFKDEHSLFLNDESRTFHTRLIERWSPKGRILLPLLEMDGVIAAARYGIAYGGTYWSFQAGYDPAYGQLSVGKLSLGWTVQCAIESGLTSVDHLPGGSGYKEEWSTHTRTVYHLEAWNPFSAPSLLFRGLRAIKRRRARTPPDLPKEVSA